MCGKDLTKQFNIARIEGSPPHVREGPCIVISVPCFDRITPACAGRTLNRLIFHNRSQDHPRMCGKDRFADSIASCGIGSPPHVREGLKFFN